MHTLTTRLCVLALALTLGCPSDGPAPTGSSTSPAGAAGPGVDDEDPPPPLPRVTDPITRATFRAPDYDWRLAGPDDDGLRPEGARLAITDGAHCRGWVDVMRQAGPPSRDAAAKRLLEGHDLANAHVVQNEKVLYVAETGWRIEVYGDAEDHRRAGLRSTYLIIDDLLFGVHARSDAGEHGLIRRCLDAVTAAFDVAMGEASVPDGTPEAPIGGATEDPEDAEDPAKDAEDPAKDAEDPTKDAEDDTGDDDHETAGGDGDEAADGDGDGGDEAADGDGDGGGAVDERGDGARDSHDTRVQVDGTGAPATRDDAPATSDDEAAPEGDDPSD